MLGLFVLAVLIGVGFLIYLGYKVPRKYFNSKIAGFLGALLVFGIFFGDHVYYYIQYRYICATQTKNEIYDNIAYRKFEKDWRTYPYVVGENLVKLKKEIEIMPKNSHAAVFDRKNNYLYFSENNGNYFLIEKIINLNDFSLIQEDIDYNGSHGGWLCSMMDLNFSACNFNSCASNKLGAFK